METEFYENNFCLLVLFQTFFRQNTGFITVAYSRSQLLRMRNIWETKRKNEGTLRTGKEGPPYLSS